MQGEIRGVDNTFQDRVATIEQRDDLEFRAFVPTNSGAESLYVKKQKALRKGKILL